MLVRACAFLLLVIACHPSASVERTMPVANLQSYRTVALRVHSSAYASQGLATTLESSVLERLRQTCGFEQVAAAGTTPADVVLDLNITNISKGGTGWIRNENQVQVDTLLVLSDGQAGDLLGTATIHGKSSGTVINNAPQENEAVAVIAKTVAELLAKSGCSGPRVARAPVPPPETGSAAEGSAAPAVDESKRAEAEGLNDKGKERLFAADTAGALALFQQAMSVLPDPKYQFNVCVALGAQEKWDDAIAACKQARSMNPPASLAGKIDQRLDALQHRQ
jgi:hypothetical protein